MYWQRTYFMENNLIFFFWQVIRVNADPCADCKQIFSDLDDILANKSVQVCNQHAQHGTIERVNVNLFVGSQFLKPRCRLFLYKRGLKVDSLY